MARLKLRRHYKLLLLLALVAVLLGAGFGDQPIVAYSLQGTQQVAGQIMIYGHALAGFMDAATDSIRIPEAVQGSSAADSQ
jgi:hypothetical protein